MSFLGFKILKVTDNNMAPIIPQGSRILVNHWFNSLFVSVNSIIVIHHHFYGEVLKKVTVIDKYGFIWSRDENDNYHSIEKIGPVSKRQVLAKVLYVFKGEQKQAVEN
ncbi:hypothetical protein [Thalassotalea sp. PLHSN55]|uniref:hypothetical protein n=1 Tax=Thalassotalea sp. PLHSN55 TaxID=3435888 RepID=UPI003F82B17C